MPLIEKIALKPCPFCGGSEEAFRLGISAKPKLEELIDGGWRVTCYACRIGHFGAFGTEAEAAAAWNTRTVKETP